MAPCNVPSTCWLPAARRLSRGRPAILAAASALVLGPLAACKDSNVPFLTAPTSVAKTPVGVQNAVTGLFSAARDDIANYVIFMSSFARDNANFTATEPRWVTEGTGIMAIPNTDQFFSSGVWDVEFRNAKFANQIVASLPGVTPAYSADKIAALTGVVQTMKALQFMLLAETRDTLGVSVYSITGGTTPQPVFCNKDVWRYIVALLDSGNTELNSGGATPIPVILPPGFGSVSAFAGPSTAAGSFAAFNRALAGKAGLELAYAIARGGAGAPTPTTPGSPDPAALTRADSALNASALFDSAGITTPVPGGFPSSDPLGVYYSWSGQSGDQGNPVNADIGTLAIMWDLVVDVDTANDARWKVKFGVNTQPVQQPSFNAAASPFIYSYYPSPSTPIPIVRTEELTLVEAQIQLGLAQYAKATALINEVHTKAGGFVAPLVVPADYLHVRDALLREQRISTVLEGSEDRTISIRMYGMPPVSDTTWNATSGPDAVAVATATAALGSKPVDQHTTVLPPPSTEIDGRNGNYTLSCP